MKLFKKRRIEKGYLLLLTAISIFLLVGYFSYAMFTVKSEQKAAIQIITGTLHPTLSSDDSSFKENKILVAANSHKDIRITLTNSNERDAKFNFYYPSSLQDKVNISYYKDSKNIPPTAQGKIIKQGASEEYHLAIYNRTQEAVSVEFQSEGGLANKELEFPKDGKIVEGIVVEVERPSANLIPVVYNEEKGKWVTTIYEDKDWYDYDAQKWANAITVKEEVRSLYHTKGKEVDIENDVLQMYVWIPRYSYTIKSEDGTYYFGKKEEERSEALSRALPGEVDVKFIDGSEKEDGTAQYIGTTPSEWYTPPGFTFAGKELSGVWIGKFESGNFENCVGNDTQVNMNCDIETLNVVIKPNVSSWRGIRVSTLELVSMGITKVGNIYGFDQTTYDSHAAKNTEWALATYLAQSKYGKYGNSLYQGKNKQVYRNSDNEYLTGCSSGKEIDSSNGTCTHLYDDLTIEEVGSGYAGAGASTTGNIYGIYDMNGGAWEYVMGALSNPNRRSGNTQNSNSGYTGLLADESTFTGREWKEDYYYNFYESTDYMNACRSKENESAPCRGHALYEVSNWYSDGTWLMTVSRFWIERGGHYSSGGGAGIFAYSVDDGNIDIGASFRIVLTPQ